MDTETATENVIKRTPTKGPCFQDGKGRMHVLADHLARTVARFCQKAPCDYSLKEVRAGFRDAKETLTRPGDIFGPKIEESPKAKKGEPLTIVVSMGAKKDQEVTGMYVDWFPRTRMAKVYCLEDHKAYTGKVKA